MSKTTNKKQFGILIDAMQGRPDIALGMFKGEKEELNRFWRNLEAKLNSAGPPSKSVAEWKKVWSDQKKYVRHKAAQNLKLSKRTGRGPNTELKFSATEEIIYHLIGMKESVKGLALTFGLGSPKKWTQAEESVQYEFDEYLEDNDVDENIPQMPPMKKVKTNTETYIPETIAQTPSRKKIKNIELQTQVNATDVVAEEIAIQKQMLETMKEQQQNFKKLYRSLDRLYDLKKEELKEQKRHNMVMEQFRLKEVEDKIEKNRQLLELEKCKNKAVIETNF